MSDDDRIDYLAGEPGSALHPAEQADLDDLRALLADPSVWAEPGPGLEDNVAAAVARAAASARAEPNGSVPAGVVPAGAVRPRRSRRRRVVAAVAGLAAAVAAIAVAVSLAADAPDPIPGRASRTSLAPAATGQVTLTQTQSGWRITLQGHGLPRLDNGDYYERG